MKKRKKIVLLLGAGFPVAWGAPFSKDILGPEVYSALDIATSQF